VIAVTLAATLVVVALFAVRRLPVKPWLKILVLAIMAALGFAVLAIELAIH
jgi:RsiW-degrading membrane proteinase PrsW (M82 family)